jgi:hypothetical protein
MQSGGDGELREVTSGGGGGPFKKKSRSSRDAAAIKRRCVSTACIACRRRKSKCDGNTPSCAACSSVYGTGESLPRRFRRRCWGNAKLT